MNYPPNDPHSQTTVAGSYPQWGQQPPPPPPPYTQPGQFGPPPFNQPPMPPQKEWYRKPGTIILALILFFPAGLFLMWRYATWSKTVKWAVTGFFALCWLIGTIANASGSTQQNASQSSPTALVATQAPTATPSPMPSPTPAPTLTPLPKPTQAPVQQPAPAQLSVTFTGESAADGDATSYVAVHTLPRAALTISVKYCSGRYATSDSLKGTQYADAAGDSIWTWDPDTTCHGMATAYVTASLNGQTASNSVSFTVT